MQIQKLSNKDGSRYSVQIVMINCILTWIWLHFIVIAELVRRHLHHLRAYHLTGSNSALGISCDKISQCCFNSQFLTFETAWVNPLNSTWRGLRGPFMGSPFAITWNSRSYSFVSMIRRWPCKPALFWTFLCLPMLLIFCCCGCGKFTAANLAGKPPWKGLPKWRSHGGKLWVST